MFKILLTFIVTLSINLIFSFDINVRECKKLSDAMSYFVYQSSDFPLIAHVIMMAMDNINIKLVPAIGQREEVFSIAQRSGAFIAINGSNYRRGGRYNGNRLNLFYLNNQIYSDLQFIRGSFGWHSNKKVAIIDKMFLKVKFFIGNRVFSVDHINQPRAPGQSVMYTSTADKSLLSHASGMNIIVDEQGMVEDITLEVPDTIKAFVYQVDQDCSFEIYKGMQTQFSFEIKSVEKEAIYNDYDFILGGAGMLLRDGELISNELCHEFSQGASVIHCHDEVAADFHTKKMQEWLIENRHPRTALGVTKKNEICIVVVDGRQKESEGLSLHELAFFMKKLGCFDALNIGGGGCSTLCINQKVINKPSAGEERPVSEALCFFE
ncbi:TPA: hypothetical protein DIC20_05475 [Candidatus Dependentiae bacterium]|nr:MAG: Exopolysaccharide biosynthesis protein [candidate division TM6 bacterium GW2011_GWF2_36_131]KKQ03142.1 MAG: Exopolysaccharide biosynthesis protein [candidate division TM6 bacterium GW2011_GWE2_36_25]KKQ19370.1 MAG: Exopolysaccharide biosynthesis protein [candidate division TM6 bacterium GW2011_GWA2_36_9]HBR71042.1 hypothetical protein [Candidatus Dependentiae bacterium]HCU01116.1 hypothetical protein [Candidatus Dependentiae bacterium]